VWGAQLLLPAGKLEADSWKLESARPTIGRGLGNGI
jgi:hypothetical protein